MLSLFSSVLNIFTKVFPMLLAFKAGRDNAQKQELETAIENVKERNKIENKTNKLSSSAISDKLLKRWKRSS
jgi:hypothetical protein|tara:strand:+ start:7845 stop:8060 length:216 start_codon:yes stop_codon:yes gene_type:complete